MHVAAKAGQVSQAELLTVYGADPGAPDSNGKTPIDYARLAFSVIFYNSITKYYGPVISPFKLSFLTCIFVGKLATMTWQIDWWRCSMN